MILRFLTVAFLSTLSIFGYSQRVGFVDVDYVYSKVPDIAMIEAEIMSVEVQLRNQLQTKVEEFEIKYADYVKNEKTMLDAIKANSQRELQNLRDNIQKLQEGADATLQQKRAELLRPVFQRIGKAIQEVAKEKQFSMVIPSRIDGADFIYYASESVDLSEEVVLKLTTPPPAKK